MLKRLIEAEEQQAKVTSEVQLALKKFQEKYLRLQTAPAEVHQRTDEYVSISEADKHTNWVTVQEFKKLMQTALTQDKDKDASGSSEEIDARFNSKNSQATNFACGEFKDAAKGLNELLQVDEGDLFDKVRQGLEALKPEIENFANPKVLEHFNYVVNQPASKKLYPNGMCDKHKEGEILEFFKEQEFSKLVEILVLLSSFTSYYSATC